MDNATHTLCGLALARMGGDRLGPLATPTIVLAANLPDLDIIGWSWGGQPWYLCHHRGLTHAVVGLVVQAFLLAAAMLLVGRRLPEPPRYRGLVLAAALGFGSHLLLDGLNTYGIRPWLPFVERWYYGDTAFIVDPWLWLMFGTAALLGAPRPAVRDTTAADAALARAEHLAGAGAHEAAHDAALAALGASKSDATRPAEEVVAARAAGFDVATAAWWTFGALVVAVILLSGRAPRGIAAVWGPLMLAALLARRARLVPAARRHHVALACALLALPYLAALRALDAAGLARAEAWAKAQGLPAVDAGVCHPMPMIPWRYRVILATGPTVHDLRVDLRADTVTSELTIRRNLDDPALSRPDVVDSPEYAAWRCFARIPFVGRDEEGRLVLGDARYQPLPKPAFCNLILDVR